ncbi:MAG TPA: hypothetical protein PKW80_07255 [Bacteroidales bacterium]|nr:hypothetical protein [Bacteroidales bacterium]
MFSERICPELCPACKHRHLSEEESLSKKMEFLKNKLFRWPDMIDPIRSVHGQARFNYRKKVCLHTLFNGAGWDFGMISRKQLVDISLCPVQHEPVCSTIGFLKDVLPHPELFPMRYFIQSGKQVLLVLKTSVLPPMDWLTEHLTENLKASGIEGFWLHLNPSAGHKIFMKHNFHLLFGREYSRDENGLEYGPMSFQQLIPGLYADSLEEAAGFIRPDENTVVVDLYCGTGYSLQRWLSSGAATAGVELSGEAVLCCGKNVPVALVLRGRCSDRLPQLDEFAGAHSDKTRLLYINPPRTGLEKEVSDWIVNNYRPGRMAYLSCSAGTLARDLDMLCSHGYQVLKIIPYDFFPQTIHVECLVMIAAG